jgi:hypothetical protein
MPGRFSFSPLSDLHELIAAFAGLELFAVSDTLPIFVVQTCKVSPALGGKMARYGRGASKSVKSAMRRRKHGTLRSGKGGKGGKVKSRKQAIAIGLSEETKKGAKVPAKKSS